MGPANAAPAGPATPALALSQQMNTRLQDTYKAICQRRTQIKKFRLGTVSKKFKSFEYKGKNPASYFKGAGTLARKFLLDTMRICNLSSDMCFPNNECGILTSVDSDEPVQSPFKLGNSK